MNSQMEESSHIYHSLISCIDEKEDNNIKIPSEDELFSEYDNKKNMDFCEIIAKKWIIDLLKYSDNKEINTIKKKIDDILNLREEYFLQFVINSNFEYSLKFKIEIAIYSYFLYFSGILFIIRKESEPLKRLKELVQRQMENIDDSNLKHFLQFLKIYIDLVDLKKKDIEIFKELEDSLIHSEYHDDIIFDVIEREYKITIEVINPINKEKEEIKQINKKLFDKIKQNVFPGLTNKYREKTVIPIIESILLAGQARLCHIAGKEKKRKDLICDSLDKYEYNSFALLQYARTLVRGKYYDEESGNLALAKKKFNDVLDLINKDHQFKNIDSFADRIKLEAFIGLGYIDYLNGLGDKANEKYGNAIEILKDNIESDFKNKKYLTAAILVNRGRNKLDNLTYRTELEDRNGKSNKGNKKNDNINKNESDQVIKIKDKKSDQVIEIKKEDEFNQVIEIYNNTEKEIKDELAEIAVIAYNNLGIYYLNEGFYEEAEEHFKQAIHIDNTKPHSKYNLGVFYYRQGQTDRALRLIRNALSLDPKFKEARQTLEKFDNQKQRRALGGEWFDWWFKSEAPKTKAIQKNKKTLLKRVVIVLLIAIIFVSIAKLAFDLYLHDLYNISINPQHYRNATTGEIIMHYHDIDENAFLAIFAIVITIAMLPFINKIKIGDVEIETESKGIHPLGPASISAGLSLSEDEQGIRLGLFFPPFWTYDDSNN